MSQKLLAMLSLTAIALSSASAAIAQTASPTNDGHLKMVMLDQAQLSNNQRSAFQQYLRTANLPPTKIGRRCQYYGKPQVWCLLLDPAQAQQVYQQLKDQPVFGFATELKDVRRLREPTAQSNQL